MPKLKVVIIPVTPFQQNCSLVFDEEARRGAIVDPGGDVAAILEAVAKSVKSHLDALADLPDREKPTIAVLVTRNNRGIEVIEALKKKNIEVIELISSTTTTRAAAGSLNYLLSYLADTQSASKLQKAYQVWRRDWREDVEKMELVKGVGDLIRRVHEVEKFIAPLSPYPSPSGRGAGARESDDWLSTIGESVAEQVIEELKEFRVNVQTRPARSPVAAERVRPRLADAAWCCGRSAGL